jgi:hypothetical protein
MTGDISDEILGAVTSVTNKWAKQRKAEERCVRIPAPAPGDGGLA